jgi:hypothetical protein
MNTWKRHLIATISATSLMVVAPAGVAAPESTAALTSKKFQMPSGNIACWYYDGYLRCDILSGLKPKPDKKCKWGDWSAMGLNPTGKAKPLCISDTVYDPDATVLEYGSKWKRAGIVCRSSEKGLRCRNGLDHGFFLSREKWKKW